MTHFVLKTTLGNTSNINTYILKFYSKKLLRKNNKSDNKFRVKCQLKHLTLQPAIKKENGQQYKKYKI